MVAAKRPVVVVGAAEFEPATARARIVGDVAPRLYQRLIAETALALPEARTLALAGGGAMIAHGYTNRATRDIDLFTEIDDAEAVHVVRALRDVLQDRGVLIRDAAEPRDHRCVAVDPRSRADCLVEVFADGG